ncbi:MAG: DNA repair protein RecO [Candidatus Saccharibacteria bacterium]
MNQSRPQQVTTGIVLTRVDYGEADRIITLITPDQGKLRLMAKGVRRIKSKLAGGIELFSVSNITFIRGRGDIGTLVSSRVLTHYGRIVSDLDRNHARL